ncbi:hypothetical protein LTR94_025362, partial [Friedmanniomyces endolithicus]
TGLSANQRAALDALVGRFAMEGAPVLVIEAPAGGDPVAAQAAWNVKAAFEAAGVPGERIQLVGYAAPDPRAPVLVGFETVRAVVPQCGTQWGNLGRSGDNQSASNFGCAVTANLAAQIADPRDIVAPRGMTPSEAGRRSVVFDAYRKGSATSATREPLLNLAKPQAPSVFDALDGFDLDDEFLDLRNDRGGAAASPGAGSAVSMNTAAPMAAEAVRPEIEPAPVEPAASPVVDAAPAPLATSSGLSPIGATVEVSIPRIGVHVFAERQDTAAAAVAIAAAETTIASVEAQVNADLSQMQDAIDGFNTDIGSLTAEIGTVTADLDSLAAQVTAAGGQIDTIQTTLGEQGASISSLQTTVSNQAGTLATHTSQISTANANISANATAISTANGNIASLSSTVSTQGGYISTLQQSVTNLSGTVSTLSSTVATQGTSITNLQSASSTQAGQIATITTQLAAGNANLLPNSTFENGLSNWDIESVAGQTYGTFSSSQGVYFYVSSGAEILPDGFYYISNQARIVCGEGEVFTATANTDLSGPAVSGSSGTYLEFLWFNGASLHSSVAGPYHAGAHSFSQSSTNRPLSKLSAACPAGANRVSVRFVGRVAGGGVNHIGVQTVKLERGSVATPYSQEASVGQSFQAISTINGSLASLSSTVSTQGATISQNATAISTLQGQQASLSSTVSAQGSSITNLQTATATLQGNVATLTTRVSASGANILPNGGLENGFAT